MWFENNAVFADREKAVAYGQKLVDVGAVETYRLQATTADVAPPAADDDEDGENDDEEESGNGSSRFLSADCVDWAGLLQLMCLCSMAPSEPLWDDLPSSLRESFSEYREACCDAY